MVLALRQAGKAGTNGRGAAQEQRTQKITSEKVVHHPHRNQQRGSNRLAMARPEGGAISAERHKIIQRGTEAQQRYTKCSMKKV